MLLVGSGQGCHSVCLLEVVSVPVAGSLPQRPFVIRVMASAGTIVGGVALCLPCSDCRAAGLMGDLVFAWFWDRVGPSEQHHAWLPIGRKEFLVLATAGASAVGMRQG